MSDLVAVSFNRHLAGLPSPTTIPPLASPSQRNGPSLGELRPSVCVEPRLVGRWGGQPMSRTSGTYAGSTDPSRPNCSTGSDNGKARYWPLSIRRSRSGPFLNSIFLRSLSGTGPTFSRGGCTTPAWHITHSEPARARTQATCPSICRMMTRLGARPQGPALT
jgi:hypothetical protein